MSIDQQNNQKNVEYHLAGQFPLLGQKEGVSDAVTHSRSACRTQTDLTLNQVTGDPVLPLPVLSCSNDEWISVLLATLPIFNKVDVTNHRAISNGERVSYLILPA
uniref:Uncharacterized protein n=1 Tax=Cacopsylla melanoneura TaxID=428564 RepID=A0A8D9FGQ7_9HEMI